MNKTEIEQKLITIDAIERAAEKLYPKYSNPTKNDTYRNIWTDGATHVLKDMQEEHERYKSLMSIKGIDELTAERDRLKEEVEALEYNRGVIRCIQLIQERDTLAARVKDQERVLNEWNQLWAPIDEAISKYPKLKLGDSKVLKVVELIELFNSVTKR
jgi:hypothetical protein